MVLCKLHIFLSCWVPHERQLQEALVLIRLRRFAEKKKEKRYVRVVSVKLFTSGMILYFRRCRDEALLEVGSVTHGN